MGATNSIGESSEYLTLPPVTLGMEGLRQICGLRLISSSRREPLELNRRKRLILADPGADPEFNVMCILTPRASNGSHPWKFEKASFTSVETEGANPMQEGNSAMGSFAKVVHGSWILGEVRRQA